MIIVWKDGLDWDIVKDLMFLVISNLLFSVFLWVLWNLFKFFVEGFIEEEIVYWLIYLFCSKNFLKDV